MYFSKFCHEVLRSHYIPYFPTSSMIRFSEGRNDKTSFGQFRKSGHALMFVSIENNMLVYLITDHNNVFILYNFLQLGNIRRIKNRPCGIMRRINNDKTGLSIDLLFYILPVNRKIGIIQLYEFGNSSA